MDAFWGRASKTISVNLGVVNQHIKFGKELGLKNPLPARGPFRLKDDIGMKEAVLQIRRTRDKGRYNKFVHTAQQGNLGPGFPIFGTQHHSLPQVPWWLGIQANCLYPKTLRTVCGGKSFFQVCTTGWGMM